MIIKGKNYIFPREFSTALWCQLKLKTLINKAKDKSNSETLHKNRYLTEKEGNKIMKNTHKVKNYDSNKKK